MFKWAIWPVNERSISRNVAHLNILVHDMINLLYYYLSIFIQFELKNYDISKTCKPDNFELHSSLKLSFKNIRGLRSKVDYEYFLESNSPDILTLCEINLDDSIDSCHFSVRGYLPLIRMDSGTHIHGLAVYVKEGLPFAQDLSLENCRFLLIFSTGFTSFSVLLFFPVSITFFVFVHGF